MKKLAISGLVAIAMVSSPVVAAAAPQKPVPMTEAVSDESSELRGAFRNPLVAGLVLIGFAILLALLVDGFADNEGPPRSP